MQRLSIGSPGTKLHSNGEAKEEKRLEEGEQKRKSGGGMVTASDEEENKVEKPHRSVAISRPGKSIHLIPILTLFCFFILYLCSYAPSQKDLAHFKGIRRSSKLTDSTEVSDFGRLLGLEKSDVLAIRSHRILQEVGKNLGKLGFKEKWAISSVHYMILYLRLLFCSLLYPLFFGSTRANFSLIHEIHMRGTASNTFIHVFLPILLR